jgi:hypothetical protein
MLTEREAYDAIIDLANKAGRQGKKVYAYGIIPPRTASDTYAIMFEARHPETASESW